MAVVHYHVHRSRPFRSDEVPRDMMRLILLPYDPIDETHHLAVVWLWRPWCGGWSEGRSRRFADPVNGR
jgi:hypothetical protein